MCIRDRGCGTGPGLAGCYEIHSQALWNRTSGNSPYYIWAWGDVLREWDFIPLTNSFQANPNQGKLAAVNFPGGGLSLSANGNSDGIVWAIVPTTASNSQVQGTLYAFSAANVGTQLWASTDYWFPTKFSIPTIVNGKVYVPTSTISTASPASVSYTHLDVYKRQASRRHNSRTRARRSSWGVFGRARSKRSGRCS